MDLTRATWTPPSQKNNKVLHLTAILLRFTATGELGRYVALMMLIKLFVLLQ